MSIDTLKIRFPDNDSSLDQDEEFCILEDGECKKKVRFHDYHEILG